MSLFSTDVSRRTLLTMSMAGAGAVMLGTSSRTTLAQDASDRGGTITGAVVGPITSLDPFSSRLSSGDQMVYLFLFNSLLEVSASGELIPELATEWAVSDDGLTYTFTVVEGVTYHDGTALDATSMMENIDRYRAEGSTFPNANRLLVIADIAAPSPTELVITLSEPNTPFLINIGTVPFVSLTALAEMGEDFQLQAVGSGPFRAVSWTPGATATFERNDTYWETAPDGDAFPYLDGVVIEGVPDDSIRLLNLRSGQFQINERLNPRDIPGLANAADIAMHETTHATPYILALNPTQAPFDNKALRQAVQFAVDRQAIIDNISFGTGYTITLPFSREAWYNVAEPAPVHDTARATALLAEAGFPDGIDVTFTIINRPTDNQIAQIAKANLDAVGIRTTIEVLERTTWVDLWTSRDGQMGLLQGGMAPSDPDSASGWWRAASLANYAGYENPAIQQLIDDANRTTDQDERLAMWQEINVLNVDDAVYTFIGAIPTTAATTANVRDIEFISGYHWKMEPISLTG